MSTSSRKKLQNLLTELTEDECVMINQRILMWVNDLGVEHNDQCLSQKPRSHTMDCDCGADELASKIVAELE